MATIKCDGEMMAEMLFPGVEGIRVTSAKTDEMGAIVLEVQGRGVPIADAVRAVFTVRATKHQRFVECELVAEPADEPSLF